MSTLTLLSSIQCSSPTKPNSISHGDYSPLTAALYSQLDLANSDYIAYRDVPHLIEKYFPNAHKTLKVVLDHGCGTGRSTRFLKALPFKFDVKGADININMITEAKQLDPTGEYIQVDSSGLIPIQDETFDFVNSAFVFLELQSKHEIQVALKEISRILKKGGHFLVTTGSATMYDPKRQWIMFNTNFPENQGPFKSGQKVKLQQIIGPSVIYEDFYWSEKDYLTEFYQAGFALDEIYRPLGTHEDELKLGIKWKDEKLFPLYTIFVLSKKTTYNSP